MSKENVIVIVKEVLICIVIVAAVLGLNFFLFKDYLKDDIEVTTVENYQKIEQQKYVVVNGNIQDERNIETYQTTNSDVKTYQTEYRYEVGTINPFVADGTINDLPTETISSNAG